MIANLRSMHISSALLLGTTGATLAFHHHPAPLSSPHAFSLLRSTSTFRLPSSSVPQYTSPLVLNQSPSKAYCQRLGPLKAVTLQPAILKTSVNAVLRLVSCCLLGITAAHKGLLDQTSLSSLSRLIFSLFQPALLFTNVATTLANPAANQSSLLILPVFSILQILIGSIYGKILAKVLRLKADSDEGRELAVCSSFANSGPLPLLFVDALFRNHADPTMYSRAVAYISFYLVAWSPMFWGYGASHMADPPITYRFNKRHPPALSLPGADLPIYLLFLMLYEHKSWILGGVKPEGAASSVPAAGPITLKDRIRKVLKHPFAQKTFSSPIMGCLLGTVVGGVFSPPTMGCLLGAVVGGVPAIRRIFIGSSAPLVPIFEALRTMGAAYLPTVLLVLAGSLAQGLKEFDLGTVKRALAICFSRFGLMPATAFLLLKLGLKYGYIAKGDPLLAFVLLMQASMPCAQNTVVILQLQQRPQAATSMARLVSLVYVLAMLPVGLLLSAILQYVGL